MGDEKTIRLTREELYNLVWTKPLTKLSVEFGLSDVGLAKACKRHNIPTPPVGYWAKLSHGHSLKKTPLPPAQEGTVNVIEFLPSKKEENSEVIKKYAHVYQEFDSIKTEGKEIDRARAVDDFHPLLRNAYKKKAQLYPNINVSENLRERAYRFAHILFRYFEALGFVVDLERNDRETITTVTIKDVKLQMRIIEKNKRIEAKPIADKNPLFYNRYSFIPTGALTLQIGTFYWFKKEWNDSKIELLEYKISKIVEGSISVAIQEKIDTLQRQEWQREFEEKQRSERERQENIRLEESRVSKLIKDAYLWKQSNLIRDYVKNVKDNAEKLGGINPQLSLWINWALKVADDMDVLNPIKVAELNEGNSGNIPRDNT